LEGLPRVGIVIPELTLSEKPNLLLNVEPNTKRREALHLAVNGLENSPQGSPL